MTKKKENPQKPGRKNLYYESVRPRFDEIAEWCRLGMWDKDIAENLGISKQTFCEYKSRYPELGEFLKRSRKKPVQQVKSALLKRACGFTYSEKRIITESDGSRRTEEYVKAALPDPASCMILLKHWARDEGWTNDPATLELKREELEFKKQQAEKEEW